MKYSPLITFATFVALTGCGTDPYANYVRDRDALVMFHNNSGPMCLAALAWLEQIQNQYPELRFEEHLLDQPGETLLLARTIASFPGSNGPSNNFGYLPVIFYQDQAYSGFDDDVAQDLEALLATAESAPQ